MDRQYTKLQQIKAKLRSIKSLNEEDILYLSTLSHKEKIDVLILFNDVFRYIISYTEITLNDL